MADKVQQFKQALSRRSENPSPQEWKRELDHWGSKARTLRKEAEERSKVDWDRIGNIRLK